MADYDRFRFAGTQAPLPDQDATASLLGVCDPGLKKIADYLHAVIEYAVDAALTGASTNGNPPIASTIRQVRTLDPARIRSHEQLEFPALFVWRKASQFSSRTVNWRQDVATCGVAYVLPPMTYERAEKIEPILPWIAHVIDVALTAGAHGSYNDGERIYAEASVAKAELDQVRYEPYEDGPLTDFWALSGEFRLHERVMPTTAGLDSLTLQGLTVTDDSHTSGSPVEIAAVELTQDD